MEQPDGRLVAGPVLTQPEPDHARPLAALLVVMWVVTCGFAFFLGNRLSTGELDLQRALADRVLAGCIPTIIGAQVGKHVETLKAVETLERTAVEEGYQRVQGFIEPLPPGLADTFPGGTHIGFVVFENCLPGVA